ncbi:hypothetical protein A2721_00230 [Candidatus Gottesmanbacteria bacterium RIFCSPHIGHO2_01_FULL_47_48]|uniref:Glycosyltransferase 2-like domain-containing protein n=1 Tax=Candidatus Gottesmanbacteria bacterium RIFCSPHIGHO2_01_FULL_47_48 TaxID=1798381 RepID=A0A1F6A3P9_9BACT|nr:MAG: hypothetical protein A2721_00230 [Candidatus Gottesmanbacteria bacterium RIFCSPHIGHO2_01_FULL_47_48]
MPKVGICTVNFNGKQDTLEFLSSLQKLDTSGLETRVFVVDGGSTDGSTQEFRIQNSKFKIPIELIEKTDNRGSAGGYNDGAKVALKWGADYILLINNDTLIKDKNLLKDLIKTMNSDPTIGLVSPKIYFAPGFEFFKERYPDKDKGKILWYAGGHFDWNNVRAVHRGIDEVDQGKYDLVEEINFISGTCMLVKKDIYDQGIFWDEGLLAYYDDNDFEVRVQKSGFRLYYDGLTSLYHKVSRTGGIASEYSDYMLTRNKLIFGFRYASLRTKIALFREASKLLLSGRPMQKKGVTDFLLGKRGTLKT